MIEAAGLLSVVIGAIVAYTAKRFPARCPGHAEALETGAGFLLISGLALSSYALPAIL
jgi:hypothetical protein